MKNTIKVSKVVYAPTNSGKDRWMTETNEGKMSIWDKDVAESIGKEFIDKGINAEIQESEDGKYKTIRSFDTVDVGKVEVPLETKVSNSDSRMRPYEKDPVGMTVDLVIAGKEVDEAIEIVKQAIGAF